MARRAQKLLHTLFMLTGCIPVGSRVQSVKSCNGATGADAHPDGRWWSQVPLGTLGTTSIDGSNVCVTWDDGRRSWFGGDGQGYLVLVEEAP